MVFEGRETMSFGRNVNDDFRKTMKDNMQSVNESGSKLWGSLKKSFG